MIQRINFYINENKTFATEKYDPISKRKLQFNDSYLLFQELIFPVGLPSNYLDEFNKVKGFSKNMDEPARVIICRECSNNLILLKTAFAENETIT